MGDTSAEDGASVAEETVSRSKHGRRRGLWKQSSLCDCWGCLPVAEKKEKLLRRVGALDFGQQLTEDEVCNAPDPCMCGDFYCYDHHGQYYNDWLEQQSEDAA